MIFCAYCGKKFTRKEHLERHILSHTNIKPHMCKLCQLSFGRKDLLQRHYSTYHEVRDPSLPHLPSISTIARRTAIACLNCAIAKTGCDKRVPCARCADKSLPCEARYTRRPSAHVATAVAAPEESKQAPELAKPNARQPAAITSPPEYIDMITDSDLQSTSAMETAPSTPQIYGADTFSEPGPSRIGGFDGFVQYNNGIESTSLNSQDSFTWNNFSMDMDLYAGFMSPPAQNMHLVYSGQADVSSGTDISSSSTQHKPSRSHTRRCRSIRDLDVGDVPSSKRSKSSRCAVEPEFKEVLASELAWPLARCNPTTFSGSCPRTAVVHLESLWQNSKHEHAWDNLELESDQALSASDCIDVKPISLDARDTLHAITQNFLHRALKTHRGGFGNKNKAGQCLSPGNISFLLLPPTNVLEYFLRKYARNLSKYYSLDAGGRIEPKQLTHGNHTSTLLILLMIAQGASTSRSTEARCLSAGLTEICRISLFDIIEQDIELCADPTVLRCALLFTMLGAWSGDKWHMDIVMGQRGMYLAMLKHAGLLEPQDIAVPTLGRSSNVEMQWRSWMLAETRSRLVYDWVLLDQEISLFHDQSPILSISELQVLLPHPNTSLFASSSAQAWWALLSSYSTSFIPTSLHNLFQDFLDDNLSHHYAPLTPLTMRLLLHPIQSILYQVRQVLTCFSDVLSPRHSSTRTLTKASTLARLEEVQSLLQKWYNLHHSIPPAVFASDSARTTNLILYHLISLNAHTSFPSLERLARHVPATLATATLYWDLSLQHHKCIFDSNSAIFHAGQILRLVSLCPSPDCRPPWASLAVYRAGLVLWFDVLAKSDPSFPQQMAWGPTVVINESTPDDTVLMDWLWKGGSVPVLRDRDGRVCRLQSPDVVLEACIGFVGGVDEGGNGTGGRLADGIARKLRMLKGNWHGSRGLRSL